MPSAKNFYWIEIVRRGWGVGGFKYCVDNGGSLKSTMLRSTAIDEFGLCQQAVFLMTMAEKPCIMTL